MTDISLKVEKRLRFIEFQLYWEGGVNRSDLTKHFRISVPQASIDLALYQKLAPDNIIYDKSKKRYLITSKFRAKFLSPDTSVYFDNLDGIAKSHIKLSDSSISMLPNYAVLPVPSRKIKPEVLQKVLTGIRKKEAIEVFYTSLSRPEPIWRWVSPLALGNDGMRWHVRCYCHVNNEFRDFAFTRFLKIKSKRAPQPEMPVDQSWYDEVEVAMRASQDLTEGQKNTFSLDYGMKDGVFITKVRKAMLFYFLRRLGFDPNNILENRSVYKLELTDPEKVFQALK